MFVLRLQLVVDFGFRWS